TALIAVIAASSPAIHLLLTPDNSQLSGVFAGISTSGETISMLFSNSGRRTGAINRINVAVKYNDGRAFSIYPPTKEDAAIFVDPGKTVGTEFYFAKARSYWTPEIAKKDLISLGGDVNRPLFKGMDCRVYVRGVNADGSQHYSNMPVRCQ